MALEESIEGLEKLESNGVAAYIDKGLNEYLKNVGNINIDYIASESGPSGYRVSIGEKSCGNCKC